MVRVGFFESRTVPKTFSPVICVEEDGEIDDILRRDVAGGIPAVKEVGGETVPLLLTFQNRKYKSCCYSGTFTEEVPKGFIEDGIDSIHEVEGLRLAFGQVGMLPAGPWTMDAVVERGPLYLSGSCLFIEVPFEEMKMELVDGPQLMKMTLREQYLTLLEMETIADADPFKRASLSQVTGIFPLHGSISHSVTKEHSTNDGLTNVASSLTKPTKCRLKKGKQLDTDMIKTSVENAGTSADDMTMHDGSYKCKHCLYATKWRSNMTRHMKTHSGVKPYTCTFCDAVFADRYNCKVHMARHERKKYACPICSAKFSGMNSLIDHKKRHENGKGRLSGRCLLPGCPKSSVNFADLLHHTREKHGLASKEQYKHALQKAYRVTDTSACKCEEHYKWIYTYVGNQHNCYLCECEYNFVLCGTDSKNGEGKWERRCIYRKDSPYSKTN